MGGSWLSKEDMEVNAGSAYMSKELKKIQISNKILKVPKLTSNQKIQIKLNNLLLIRLIKKKKYRLCVREVWEGRTDNRCSHNWKCVCNKTALRGTQTLYHNQKHRFLNIKQKASNNRKI